jgi:acyl dehydratase
MSEGALVNTSAVRWPDPVLAGVTVRSRVWLFLGDVWFAGDQGVCLHLIM